MAYDSHYKVKDYRKRWKMEKQELLTIEEMSARYKLPKSWFYSRSRLRGSEAIPGIIRCGKYLRFEPETFLNFIKEKYGKGQQ